ncbi:MAG: TraR/DksA C4-type zinc finger protein [Planctomycetota bacterium]|nr:TraR/DksA C4-type zinc finger protein [Planctomycetota bacterium]
MPKSPKTKPSDGGGKAVGSSAGSAAASRNGKAARSAPGAVAKPEKAGKTKSSSEKASVEKAKKPGSDAKGIPGAASKPGSSKPTQSKPSPNKPDLTKSSPAKPSSTKATAGSSAASGSSGSSASGPGAKGGNGKSEASSKPAAAKQAAAAKGNGAGKQAGAAKGASSAKPATGKSEPKLDGKLEGKVENGRGEPKGDSRQAKDAKGGEAPKTGAGSGRKGISIVSNKPARKPKKAPPATPIPEFGLDTSGFMRHGPLIPSGAKAARQVPLGSHTETASGDRPAAQTPFNKRELARYRGILLDKKRELVGDVSKMEEQALRAESGSLSNTPQHMAEQGSETYDQSLALEIAAADRRLLKEIDDAIARIDAGSYGVCEVSGKPISPARLEELPWARHSIEAARELERRSMRG